MGHQDSSGQKVIKDTIHQRHWLELVEYASLAGSAVGSLAVAISGQAFYAVVPLTLALSLNVANRNRFDRAIERGRSSEVTEVRQSMEKLEKNAVKALLKLRQQLLKEIQSLREARSALSDLPVAESLEMQGQLGTVERSAASLQESLVSLGDKPLTAGDWEEVKNRLLGLEEAMAALHQELEETGDKPDINLSQIETKIDYLERQNKEVIKPHLKRLISLVKQLQKTSSTEEPERNNISVSLPKKENYAQAVKQGDRGI
ncbi:MAG: hypothetical protein SXA11_25770 [Cyanobacteriota bacterium]|nr:hypothetical protein [Cyanobacteriota bacterium]